MRKTFVTDVDGCLTDGTFGWSPAGEKIFKTFGPDDSTALKDLITGGWRVLLVSADHLGWAITESRAKHMGVDLAYAGERFRGDHVRELVGPLEDIVFMGDGYYDAPVIEAAGIGIAPSSADDRAYAAADYVTRNPGGRRAVAEAVRYVQEAVT